MREITCRYLLLILSVSGIAFLFNEPGFAQPTLTDRTKIKNFGKSLKKYDQKKDDNLKKDDRAADANGEVIRVKTDLVVNDVLVVNQKGNAILGLKQSDFVVTENGAAQQIDLFSFGESANIPRSIVLIIDYSTSLYPYIKNSVAAAKALVDKLGPQDRMAIATDDVQLLVEFTKDKTLLKKTLDALEAKTLSWRRAGKSRQFSALLAVLNEMFDEEDIRPIIIFQTDGDELPYLKSDQDAVSYPDKYRKSILEHYGEEKFGLSDIRKSIESSRATIYSVIPGLRFLGISREAQMDRAKITIADQLGAAFVNNEGSLTAPVGRSPADEVQIRIAMQTAIFKVTELSGGYTAYLEKPADAENVYAGIFTVINNRYIIGCYPTDEERDGKRRNVKIEVRGHPEYIVLGRKTYIAAED